MNLLNVLVILNFISSSFAYGISFENEWPEPQLEIISRFLPDNPKILEAGGHYAEDTLKMLKQWPDATLYVFEPNPTAFQILLEKTSSFPNVFSYPLALYTYEGYHPFFIQLKEGNDGASSLFSVTKEWDFFFTDRATQVPCISLNTWVQRNQITHIDFMWLDLEGAELQVLKHGLDLLKTVKVIYVETNFCKFREETTLFKDLDPFLREQGFELIHHVGWPSFQGNALYIRKLK